MTDAATLGSSFTERTEVLMPNDTNHLGRAFGGRILEWMDVVSSVACRRFAGHQVVTASIDHVDFHAPIATGDVVTVESYVFDTGNTSLTVRTTVRAEDPEVDEEWDVTTAFFTFVAVDDDDRPVSVPSLDCPSEDERALRERALDERRDHREALIERLGDEGASE
ncbi:cytosolic long-chain acyl-CoA thioester hydrolase family protein [Halarchaeum acidiphilum MH1-52-1]|uniref:Cytosolic long-chain acyl-CoA thioester hydrolase family protein n=1 Tax=Halarchaeum acidiphilum MH1-52-1 TaxID=1261545 RepID=U3AA13_9EURY|nr:acyl-CoA thioesterase [Halarchaeum acidiphilum]GAD51603.1 cytosolic long-chain acyl-CoA thioester hydrolase family protein [Halarchaeum acidiphilum MH1-52-1]